MNETQGLPKPLDAQPALKGKTASLQRVIAFLLTWDVGLILLFMIGLATLLTPNFLTPLNLTNLLRQTSILAILAIGQFLVILSGGFDLSVAAVMALSSVIMATYGNHNLPTAIVAAIGAGALLGLANGMFVTQGKIPPFIVTLAMMGIARGLAFNVTEKSVMLQQPAVRAFGDLTIGVIPMPGLIWFLLAAIVFAFLRLTRTGIHIYAIGGREDTARLAGVKVNQVKILVYTLSGTLSGTAGVLFVARSGSGMPHVGSGWELDTIAAVVIGGADLFGGEGSLPKAMVGVLIYMMIRNVMNLLSLDPYLQDILKAVIILAAVSFGLMRARLER